jgi:diguanylate cyclase (GGDEF)-like protein
MQTGAPLDSEQIPQEVEPRSGGDPAAAPAAAEASGNSPSGADAKEPDPRFEATAKATIMIVDDEPVIVDILRGVLEEVGYRRFIETTDSTRALELLSEHKPDVVLLDVNMPEVTGLDILNAMRADEDLKHIPTIVLTGASDSATKLLALGLGATDVLGKPVDSSELALRVRNTLTAKAHQDRLLNFDELTGLPNRRLFMERCAKVVSRAEEAHNECALLLIGLDRFQQVNESLGTEIGDGVLNAVAAALEEHIRETDLPGLSGMDEEEIALSRVDGDEFALIVPNLPHVEVADLLSRRIMSMLEKPFHVGGSDVHITASIGMSVFPEDGTTTDTLLMNAGAAMSAAKQSGGSAYQHHSKEHNVKSREREMLEDQLRFAPSRHQLFLSIQPKLEVGSGRVCGAEGAIRWKHPKWGVVPPQKFLPVAEETGLIIPAGEKVLYLACALGKQWQQAGIDPVSVSMNISGAQFRDAQNLTNAVRQVLEKTGLDAKYLTLNFAESVIMENPERNLDGLRDLKSLGVSLCLDHFGTGLSSMGYLKYFPLDELKIDRLLVKDVPENSDASAIVVAAIKLAKGMGLRVVAAGVRSEDQLAFLKRRLEKYHAGYSEKVRRRASFRRYRCA